jgi:predicted ATPase
MPITQIQFRNFKVLREATLNLGRLTLLVGPNGSGKSTALEAFRFTSQVFGRSNQPVHQNDAVRLKSVGATGAPFLAVKVEGEDAASGTYELAWATDRTFGVNVNEAVRALFSRMREYSLDARLMCHQAQLEPGRELSREGQGLAVVLDQLRDGYPERFEALNLEWSRWLPEYDRILFDTPSPGHRSIKLRTKQGQHPVPASELSQGTVLALGFLTLAYLPSVPKVVGVEEPDRGIHPRLLRHIQDALYRLAYPENFGEGRQPVQVVATTQSPYFLDLFRDHPEEVVIAQKTGLDATFERLSDHRDVDEILNSASLGEIWYSGVLGGVPVAS